MSTFFDSLPDGMTADVAPPIFYIRDVPHPLIDLFESLVTHGWRDVMYVNVEELCAAVPDSLWLSLPQTLRELIHQAKVVGCETLALQPVALSGMVYRDDNGNFRLLTVENFKDHLHQIGRFSQSTRDFIPRAGSVRLNTGEEIFVPLPPDQKIRSMAGAMAAHQRRQSEDQSRAGGDQ